MSPHGQLLHVCVTKKRIVQLQLWTPSIAHIQVALQMHVQLHIDV
jgi:hypothetical protein